MNYSIAYRGCIFGALLLSVGWKVAAQIEIHLYRTDDLVTFFKRNHFEVATEVVSDVPIIHATTAKCHVRGARLYPDGSNRDLVQQLTSGQDRPFVVFDGAVYAQQPVFWTVLSYFRSRFLRELGFAERATAVISIAANSSCNAEKLPWHELPDLQKAAWR